MPQLSLNDLLRDALRKGLGRAALLIDANPGSDAVRDEVLRACRINLAYDAQCEDSRAPWLYRLILRTGVAHDFAERLLAELDDPDQQNDGVQMFAILCLAAADDPGLERESLRKFLFSADFDAIGASCLGAYVALTGVVGLADCARNLHAALVAHIAEQDGWALGAAKEALTARAGEAQAEAEMLAARAQCPALHDLMTRFEQAQTRPRRRRAPVGDYAAFKAKLDGNGGIDHVWLAQASDADLRKLARALVAETDLTMLWRYLRVFARRDYPLAPETILPLVDHADAGVARGAARALGGITHPAIRARALALLNAQPERALLLLRANSYDGDFGRVTAALASRALDEDRWHGVAMAVLDMLDGGTPDPEGVAVLLKLYQENPCSLCRTGIVKALARSGPLPDWLTAELPFDADADTARLPASMDVGAAPD
jgi:hypothetical protein